ncbi:MAG TPA: hypothetical protein VJC07_03510 [Candidatus Nanoarchaeia archaeon]|nr:hypothetical protein [Candidatus Nanoarchaeia archaeon]
MVFKAIRNIIDRNKRVELDKAWETSKTRRFIIAVLTYVVIAIFLIAIDVKNPWLNALVPAAGFWLSTLTLPFFKKAWARYFYRK